MRARLSARRVDCILECPRFARSTENDVIENEITLTRVYFCLIHNYRAYILLLFDLIEDSVDSLFILVAGFSVSINLA